MQLAKYNVQSRLTEEMNIFLQNSPAEEQLKSLLIGQNAVKKVHLILEQEINELAQAEKEEQKNHLIKHYLEQQLITDLNEINTIIPSKEQKLHAKEQQLVNELSKLKSEQYGIKGDLNTIQISINQINRDIKHLEKQNASLNSAHQHPSKDISSHQIPLISPNNQSYSVQMPKTHSHQETPPLDLTNALNDKKAKLNQYQFQKLKQNGLLTSITNNVNSKESDVINVKKQLTQLVQQRAEGTARIIAHKDMNAELYEKLSTSNYEKLCLEKRQDEQNIACQANILIHTAQSLNHNELVKQTQIIFPSNNEIHQLARLMAEHIQLTTQNNLLGIQLEKIQQDIKQYNATIHDYNIKIKKLDDTNVIQNNNKKQLNADNVLLTAFKAHNKMWRNTYSKIILGALAINLLTSLPYFLNLGLFIPALPIVPLLIPALMFASLGATIIVTAMTLNYAIRYWHNDWQISNNEKQIERITAQVEKESAEKKEINETRLPRCKQLLKKDCEEEEKLVVRVSKLKQEAEDIFIKAGTLAYSNARLPSLSPVTSATSFFQIPMKIPMAEAIIVNDNYKEPSAPEHSFDNLSPR